MIEMLVVLVAVGGRLTAPVRRKAHCEAKNCLLHLSLAFFFLSFFRLSLVVIVIVVIIVIVVGRSERGLLIERLACIDLEIDVDVDDGRAVLLLLLLPKVVGCFPALVLARCRDRDRDRGSGKR